MGFSCVTLQLRRSSHYTNLSSKKIIKWHLLWMQHTKTFPPNRTLPSKANAVNKAWTKSIFFKKYLTNLKAKTNPNPNLQNTLKKTGKKTFKKIIARMGVEPVTRAVQSENCTAKPPRQCWPGANFRSFNIHRKGENAIKNKTNTVPNPTINPSPNPIIDEAGKRKELK